MSNSTSSRRATYLLVVGVALAALGPAASTAIATVDVFHSAADDGVNPGGSVGLTEESSAADV